MPSRAIRYGGRRSMARPSYRMAPRRGCSSPTIVRIVVVLPAPLRPSKTVTRSRRTVTDTPCRMWCCPMSAWTSPTSRTASGSDTGAAAEIRGLDLGVARDRLRRVVGDEAAVLEDGDRVRERHDHVDLVLDEQD